VPRFENRIVYLDRRAGSKHRCQTGFR